MWRRLPRLREDSFVPAAKNCSSATCTAPQRQSIDLPGVVAMPQTYNVGSRSLFVTLVGWIFIVIAAAGTASALLQGVGAALGDLERPLQPAGSQALPLLSGFLSGHLHWVMGSVLLLAVASLAGAIGLLLRLEWARRTVLVVLGVGIAASLMGLWLQHEVIQAVVQTSLSQASLPSSLADVFGGFVTASRVMAVVVTLGMCALFGWVMRRLMSDSVRQEFA
jgi:hypothetical protein